MVAGYSEIWLLELDIVSLINLADKTQEIIDEQKKTDAMTALLAAAGDSKQMREWLETVYSSDEEAQVDRIITDQAKFRAAMNGGVRGR